MKIETPLALCEAIDALLALPRGEQINGLKCLINDVHLPVDNEDWNTRFGPRSLFEAWTHTELIAGLYRGNADILSECVPSGWRGLEIGGGDGQLWRVLQDRHALEAGCLVLVDPAEATHEQVRSVLPADVSLQSITAPVESALGQLRSIEPVDFVVSSLTLHHVAGLNETQRLANGLVGPGKKEVLAGIRQVLRPGGIFVLNEADVHCELTLPPGDPVLADRLFDSYVRRTARTLCREIRASPTGERAYRLAAIVDRWCLRQVMLAWAPAADRDVYELDVSRWDELLAQAGFRVIRREFSDQTCLFVRYFCRASAIRD